MKLGKTARVGVGLIVAGIVVLGVAWGHRDRADGSGGAAPKEPGSPAASERSGRQFTLFDATLYQAKPDLRGYGVKPLKVLYPGAGFWLRTGPGADNVDRSTPHESSVRKLGRELASENLDIVVVDIEHWPLTGSETTVRESVEKYRRVLEWLRAEAPRIRIGIYGAPPLRNYWAPVKGRGQADYARWEADNRKLSPIAERADVLFPSLYTFYNDRTGWVKYAEGNLEEGRKYGKPMYAFLWPQFHDSNKMLQLQYLPPDFWRLELETCYRKADGVVIWGGYKQTWDPKAPWWQETVKFLREKGLSPEPAAR